MLLAKNWKDYELLDCGNGEKLERWGNVILLRPDPQIIWNNTNLLEKYNKDENFTCNKLGLFGYSFKFNELEMIKNNIKQVKNLKNIDVKVYTRY